MPRHQKKYIYAEIHIW